MQTSGLVFRRFETFEAAEDFALSVRSDVDDLKIIYSPVRSPLNTREGIPFVQDTNDGAGPWCVDNEIGMIRSWESIVAWYPRKGRARKALHRINWLKAHRTT